MRIKISDAAKKLGISRQAIYKHVRAGRLETFKDGKKTVVDLDALLALDQKVSSKREATTKPKPQRKKPRSTRKVDASPSDAKPKSPGKRELPKPTLESVVGESQGRPAHSSIVGEPARLVVEGLVAAKSSGGKTPVRTPTINDGSRESFVKFWLKRFGSFFTTLDDLAKAAIEGGYIEKERDITDFLKSQVGERAIGASGQVWKITEYRGDFLLGKVEDESLEVKPDIVTDFPRVKKALETNTPPRRDEWSEVEEAEYIRHLRDRGANTVDEINRLPSSDEDRRKVIGATTPAIAEKLKDIPPMRNPFPTPEDDDTSGLSAGFSDVLTSGDVGVIDELKKALERGGNRALIHHAIETHWRCEPRMRRTLIKCLKSA